MSLLFLVFLHACISKDYLIQNKHGNFAHIGCYKCDYLFLIELMRYRVQPYICTTLKSLTPKSEVQ